MKKYTLQDNTEVQAVKWTGDNVLEIRESVCPDMLKVYYDYETSLPDVYVFTKGSFQSVFKNQYIVKLKNDTFEVWNSVKFEFD